MKPTTVLTSSGSNVARHGVGARLERLLVDAVMRVGRQRRALAGLEVHDVVADGAALQRQRRLARLPSAWPSVTPNEALAASVPPIDWNTRSTGAPRAMASIVVVTWVSTQLCVGMSKRPDDVVEHGEQIEDASPMLSVAGLMPMTASPQP